VGAPFFQEPEVRHIVAMLRDDVVVREMCIDTSFHDAPPGDVRRLVTDVGPFGERPIFGPQQKPDQFVGGGPAHSSLGSAWGIALRYSYTAFRSCRTIFP